VSRFRAGREDQGQEEMNLKEAYATLKLAEGTTPEEAKKQYKKLAKEFHPDVNKGDGAEDKFKKINEAYECVKNGKGNDPIPQDTPVWNPFGGSNPFGNPFGRQTHVIQLEHIELKLTITFKESILGCKKEVKYSRSLKCQPCDGGGDIKLNNGCKKCGGKGQTVIKRGPSVMIMTCTDCYGKSNTETCKSCNGSGLAHADVSISVSVPAGIIDGNTLKLKGMGNYAGSFMGIQEQYTDAMCHLTVIAEPGLFLQDKNIVSHLTIPLLDALQGCTRTVKTIHGDKEISIRPQARNRDEVIIPYYGVSGLGDQKVILDVKYPENIDKLVNALTDEVM